MDASQKLVEIDVEKRVDLHTVRGHVHQPDVESAEWSRVERSELETYVRLPTYPDNMVPNSGNRIDDLRGAS